MSNGKKILVAYYSRTGCTERVAKDVAARLNADLEKITDQKNRSGILGWLYGGRDAMKKVAAETGRLAKDPTGYDIVVVGTPIWAWNMTPAVRAYLEKTKGKLKNAAFFTTSASTPADKTVSYMEELSGKKAVAQAGFNGGELGNEKKYNDKLSAFAEALQSR